jgi:hypothetical protein
LSTVGNTKGAHGKAREGHRRYAGFVQTQVDYFEESG